MEINKEFIEKALNKPKVIGIIADVNQGKSMLIYNILDVLKQWNTPIFTYGLRAVTNTKQIYSIDELEEIRDSIIIVDEFFNLFDLHDRKKVRLIENTFRLINHRNNILVLCGVPENFKKFVSGKIDLFFFKKCTQYDFINGSRAKNVCMNYKGYENGSVILNIPIDEVLFFDGSYQKLKVNYLKDFDTKLSNVKILRHEEKKKKFKLF